MLVQLSIRDLAIVERIDLDLASGMTALTGETGAGKSILIDALGLALGERASGVQVRPGAERAEVAAVFELAADSPPAAWLHEHELDDTEGECILRRTIRADGRSRASVNGRAVPVQLLRDLGDALVDVHGQHAHQSLLNRDAQRAIVDAYAGNEAELTRLGELYRQWRALEDAIESHEQTFSDRETRVDFLRYQIEELAPAAIGAEELETLGAEHRRLSHADEIVAACAQLVEALAGDGPDAAGIRVGAAARRVAELAELDSSMHAARELLDDAVVQIDEAAAELRRYRDDAQIDPERLHEVDRRLAELHGLARKHHVRIDELAAQLAHLQEELDAFERSSARLAELRADLDRVAGEYRETDDLLHARRVDAAGRLDDEVTAHMHELGMLDGGFRACVVHEPEAAPRPAGSDRVEFEVATNAGQPFLPLAKVASGGELSRISLAIQLIRTGATGVPTLIFDEVDAGIGGRLAEIVGRQLRVLSGHHQVLCVTHLAQVASQAVGHVQIVKDSGGEETQTSVRPLSGDERVHEIARMLGGVELTEQTVAHARDMLARA